MSEKITREFRVKSVRRYIVTDWEDRRGENTCSQTVKEIAECANVEVANDIALTYGRVHPGSLVSTMDPKGIDQVDNADVIYYLTSDMARELDKELGRYGGMLGFLDTNGRVKHQSFADDA